MVSQQMIQPGIERVIFEGWSLHERLRQAQTRPTAEGELETWRTLVAPDQQANFTKRLEWDDLIPEQAAWALNPAPATGPTPPLLVGHPGASTHGCSPEQTTRPFGTTGQTIAIRACMAPGSSLGPS
jgi:hypothetical protein